MSAVRTPTRARTLRLAPLLLLPVLAVGAACSWFDDPSPDTVRVMIDGDEGALRIITSTRFLTTTNERGDLGVEVFASDTTEVTFPFERTWNISDQYRFLLMGFPRDSAAVTVRVRVMLDGETDYDNTVEVLLDRPLRYIYLFNQQVVHDFELL